MGVQNEKVNLRVGSQNEKNLLSERVDRARSKDKEIEKMATELKSNRVLNYDGSREHWEGWSEKTLARGKRKGYKKLLTGRVKIPTASEYELALLGSSAEDQEIVRLAELNEEAYEDIILSIDHTTKEGKVAFSLVKNCKTAEFPEGNCKLAWDRLESKYAPKTVPSLLKLKKKFANSKLETKDQNPDEWISELESIRNEIDKINLSTQMSDQDFMIHVLNNLPAEYDVVLDGMENRLLLADSNPSKLTIEDIRAKVNNRFERIEEREEEGLEVDVGYFAKNYRNKGAKGEQKFTGNCFHCGGKGHRLLKCPEYLKMKEKMEKAKKVKEEMANFGVCVDDDESLGFPY